MLANQDILKRSHVWKQADILIRARDAAICDLVRSQAVNGGSFEGDFPFVDLSKTCDHIEERGLACAVGSDNADDGFFWDVKIHRVDSNQAAKAFDDFFCGLDNSH